MKDAFSRELAKGGKSHKELKRKINYLSALLQCLLNVRYASKDALSELISTAHFHLELHCRFQMSLFCVRAPHVTR